MLGESELHRIGDYVRGNLSAWLIDVAPHLMVGQEVLQSNVRVVDELKHLRQTMEARFAAQQTLMETRFAAIDERFEAQQTLMETRFAAVDERFEAQQTLMETRFAAVDKRFEAQQTLMETRFAAVDKRFEAVDKRFEDMNKRFAMLQWIGLVGFAGLGVLMTVLGTGGA